MVERDKGRSEVDRESGKNKEVAIDSPNTGKLGTWIVMYTIITAI